jgi:hypothetical protein
METSTTTSGFLEVCVSGVQYPYLSTMFAGLRSLQPRAPNQVSSSASASYTALKESRAWDLAVSPAKSLPMQAFMLYMSGGGVQIFSMGIVFMLLLTPFKNIAGMNDGSYFNPSRSNSKF